MPTLETLPSSRSASDVESEWPLPATRILVVSDRVGATQYISFLRPLRRLIEREQVFLYLERLSRHWRTEHVSKLFGTARPDMVVLSRCMLDVSSLVMNKARSLGIPVIFHVDDDLLDVPTTLSSRQYDYYSDPARLAALRRTMEESDLIYVSTRALAARLMEHGIKGHIVHGDLYCSVDVDALPRTYPATFPVIGYMGSAGHGADLRSVAGVIERLLDAMPFVSFETFGTIEPLPQLSRFGSRVTHHGPVASYDAFLEKLSDLGWWIGLAPLEDHSFNRCKADTKWVEYSYAGMAVVAQNVPVYAQACAGGAGILAMTEAEWTNALQGLIRNASAREALVRTARTKLKAEYSHDRLRKQVLSIFSQARALQAEPLATAVS